MVELPGYSCFPPLRLVALPAKLERQWKLLMAFQGTLGRSLKAVVVLPVRKEGNCGPGSPQPCNKLRQKGAYIPTALR